MKMLSKIIVTVNMNRELRTLINLAEDKNAWKLCFWISVYLGVKDEYAYAC